MAFRGRGRGRGRGRVGSFEFRMAKHEPFIDFPEDVNLPDVSIFENLSNEDKILISGKVKLERFWKSSSYYLEDTKRQDAEDEQYVDKLKRKAQQPQHFGTYMKLNVSHFPAELIQGGKRVQVDSKRLRWDTKRVDEFSLFEKLKEKDQDADENNNAVKEKKDGDEEAEEDLEREEVESSEDDYAQNQDFDDDEDDFNIEDEPEEDYYE